MTNSKGHLAIIPARSGSKGIPDKNIRMLGGIPLVAWSIKTAVASKLFSRIVVSTDSEEYASVAIDFGAEIPWLRDKTLSQDDTPTVDVIIDILERFENEGETYQSITLLQPTSPLRTAADILMAYRLLIEKKGNSIVSVTSCDHPPQWCNILPEDHSLENFISPEAMVPRQHLPVHYRINGAVYMAYTNPFREYRTFLCPGSYAMVMPLERSVDIDNLTDLLLAETIVGQKNYKKPWIH